MQVASTCKHLHWMHWIAGAKKKPKHMKTNNNQQSLLLCTRFLAKAGNSAERLRKVERSLGNRRWMKDRIDTQKSSNQEWLLFFGSQATRHRRHSSRHTRKVRRCKVCLVQGSNLFAGSCHSEEEHQDVSFSHLKALPVSSTAHTIFKKKPYPSQDTLASWPWMGLRHLSS